MRQKLLKMTLIVGAVFIAATAAFYFYLCENIADAQSVLSLYMPNVEAVTGEDGTLSLLSLFRSNLFACVTCVGLGFIPFVFLPAWALLSNGMMIGALLAIVQASGAVSLTKTIALGLLPHGIFELPAFFLSMAMGIYLCRTLTMKIFGRAKEEKILPMLNGIAKGFVMIVIPLLIIAAVLECYLTPQLMSLAGIN